MTTSKEPISYLIIAEGQELELKLFESLFEKMLPGCRVEKFVNGVPAGYESISVEGERDERELRVVLVKPVHNTLSEIVKDIKANDGIDDVYKLFYCNDDDTEFRYFFYVFDVDYTSDVDLAFALEYFCDPTDHGLLLLSSPCSEAIADFHSTDFSLPLDGNSKVSNTYKPMVNMALQPHFSDAKKKNGTSLFIRNNIFALLRHSLARNRSIYGSDDFMESWEQYGKKHLPQKLDSEIYYPVVTSFVYILVGIHLGAEATSNPFSTLDAALKAYAFNYERDTESKISALSPYLS